MNSTVRLATLNMTTRSVRNVRHGRRSCDMLNDYDATVTVTHNTTYWSWKVEYPGLSIASGHAVSIGRALQDAQMYGSENGYEIGRWCFVDEDGDHLIYGADHKHSINAERLMSSFWDLWVLVALCLLVIQLGYIIFF